MSFTLVLGGIRSGKSARAVELAAGIGGRVAVVATGTASDPEMAARIAAHQAARPAGWTLYEQDSDVGGAVAEGSADVILLDAVDGLVARLPDPDDCCAQVLRLERRAEHLVVVSSEVGLSLVALTPAGRAFSDALGAVNQRLAAEATRVVLVVAGLPVTLKGS